MPRTRGIAAALLACLLAGVPAGCSGETTGPQPRDPDAGAAGVVGETLAQRCGPSLPRDAAARALELDDGAGTTLSGAAFGPETSGVALVLLHQTGPGGLCGWGRFAARAAAAGVPSVAIDMCGYGDSVCAEGLESDPAALVDLAGEWARRELGADRLVLVGASMGGSSTVLAVSDGAAVDGWVDVSGVSTWNSVRLQSRARALRHAPPGLVVYARTDGPLEWGAARRLARTSGARFVDGGSGHGYELLTDYRGRLLPAGRAVLRFAAS